MVGVVICRGCLPNTAIIKRLAEIDKTLLEHDTALRDLYYKLLPLLEPEPAPRKRRIGFIDTNKT